ncbi:14915_t:CDS:2, partial [Acaulospora colombiana]
IVPFIFAEFELTLLATCIVTMDLASIRISGTSHKTPEYGQLVKTLDIQLKSEGHQDMTKVPGEERGDVIYPKGLSLNSHYDTIGPRLSYCFISYHNRDYDLRAPPNTRIATWYGTSSVETLNMGADEDAHTGSYDLFFKSLRQIGATLEFLDIVWATSRYGSQLTIGSLQDFRSLKTLFINYSFLFQKDIKDDLPMITAVLPPNLEVLGMHAEAWSRLSDSDKLEGIRRILVDKSPSCIPSLQTIGDISNPAFLSPLEDLASKMNVKIELEGKYLTFPHTRSARMHPDVWSYWDQGDYVDCMKQLLFDKSTLLERDFELDVHIKLNQISYYWDQLA